jgi:hypothetical protein
MDTHVDTNYFQLNLKPELLRQEAQELLLSSTLMIEVLYQRYSEELSLEPRYYLKNMADTAIYLLSLFHRLYPFESLDALYYIDKPRAFIVNPKLTLERLSEHMLITLFQLRSLCIEATNSVLLEHLPENGGNMLINITVQIQKLQQITECLLITMPL